MESAWLRLHFRCGFAYVFVEAKDYTRHWSGAFLQRRSACWNVELFTPRKVWQMCYYWTKFSRANILRKFMRSSNRRSCEQRWSCHIEVYFIIFFSALLVLVVLPLNLCYIYAYVSLNMWDTLKKLSENKWAEFDSVAKGLNSASILYIHWCRFKRIMISLIS